MKQNQPYQFSYFHFNECKFFLKQIFKKTQETHRLWILFFYQYFWTLQSDTDVNTWTVLRRCLQYRDTWKLICRDSYYLYFFFFFVSCFLFCDFLMKGAPYNNNIHKNYRRLHIMARGHRTTNKRSIKHCVMVKSGWRQQDIRNFRFYIHLILEKSPWEANTVTQLVQKLNTF